MEKYQTKPLSHQPFPKAEIKALEEVMALVMQDWAFLPTAPIGLPADGPVEMAMEWSVRLSGPALCFLNLRTVPEMALLIAQNVQGVDQVPDGGEDAFREFVNIFCGHLLTYLWGQSGKSFDPFLPIPTTPSDWPGAEPSAACVFIVENNPIEIRLWIKEQ